MHVGSGHRFDDHLTKYDHFDDFVENFYDSVLSSLPRRDQRATARMYLRGLLCTEGRKSARNIAARLAGSAAVEQRLQHFVGGSTWDWRLVRGALAREIGRRTSPHAYVVRSVVVPRNGAQSAGKDTCGRPGQIVGGQRATGMWTVGASGSVPVNWRLHPADERHRQGGGRVVATTAVHPRAQNAIDMYFATQRWGTPGLPLVFDGAEPDLATVVGSLGDRPWLARVPATVVLTAGDHRLGSRRGDLLAARDIVEILRRTAQVRPSAPPEWPLRPAERSIATVVAVRTPWADHRELALLGEQSVGRPAVPRLWLTNMVGLGMAELIGLTRAPAAVAEDFATIGDRVGVLDYLGRSVAGWHRHVTLASVAHAAVTLFGTARPRIRSADN